jgi:predicted alpha/beta superfamily hydrolase
MSDSWQKYTETVQQHTVVGDLRIRKGVPGPMPDNLRDVYVWLPPEYETSERRYPVIYMHDGQNLFDQHLSYSGEWQVDETMTALSGEGRAAIIVGLQNQSEGRRIEYNPYPHQLEGIFWEGSGDDYIRFLVETVKPMIDSDFRTLPQPDTTGIAGSSMGGLISLHGFLTRQDVFGLCGCFSPAFWIGTGLSDTIQQYAQGTGKIYLDVGGKEGEVIVGAAPHLMDVVDAHDIYLQGVRVLRDALVSKGYQVGDTLLYVEDAEALHNEPAWAQRLPDALRFLLPIS